MKRGEASHYHRRLDALKAARTFLHSQRARQADHLDQLATSFGQHPHDKALQQAVTRSADAIQNLDKRLVEVNTRIQEYTKMIVFQTASP